MLTENTSLRGSASLFVRSVIQPKGRSPLNDFYDDFDNDLTIFKTSGQHMRSRKYDRLVNHRQNVKQV